MRSKLPRFFASRKTHVFEFYNSGNIISNMETTDYDIVAKKDTLWTMIFGIGSKINFKLLISIFVIFLTITSDVFTDRILSQFMGAVEFKTSTSWGTVIQGLFLVIGYIIMDLFISQGLI